MKQISAYNSPSIPPKKPPSNPPMIESTPRKSNSFITVPPFVSRFLCITKEISGCINLYTAELKASL